MRLPAIRRVAELIAVATATATIVAPTTAATVPMPERTLSIQQQIDAQLRVYPGGKQVNETEVSYANGAIVVSFAPPAGAFAAPNCPSGSFCLYENTRYRYPRLKSSLCGWQDLSWRKWHDRADSLHINLPKGEVSFLNHAAGQESHGFDELLFILGPKAADADLAPHNDKVDHVIRHC
jgi:hypothetical protein